MDFKEFHKNLLQDVKTELSEEFDRNFERKAFFDKKWTNNVLINRKGSQMARTNNLRRGYRSKIEGNKIIWTNSMPYAKIQNEGGEIEVTKKMKSYFWAMYYQSIGGQIFSTKTKKPAKTKKNERLSIEAAQFKALALMPIGKKIKIPERRVIGNHSKVREAVERVANDHLKELNNIILNNLK